MEHVTNEGVSRSICDYPANYLPRGKVNLFQQSNNHYPQFGKLGKKDPSVFHHVDVIVYKVDSMDRAPKVNRNRTNNV
jgi:hypothetical protein